MYSTRINAPGSLFVTLALFCLSLVALAGCGSTSNDAIPVSTATPSPAPIATITPVSSQVGTRVKTADGAYTNLKPAELKAMLDHKDFLLIDTHTPHEGQLPQTDGRIPYDQVEQNIAMFPQDKSSKIVLTCMSGSMSTEAAKTLVRLGYTNIYNLDGGMSAWKAAGYELIPEDK